MPDDNGNADDVGMSGVRKAATFLLALDPPVAGKVMKHMSERELSILTEEMTRIGDVTPEQVNVVLEEYVEAGETFDVEPLLERMLEEALGPEKAKKLLDRVRRRTRDREPFRSLRKLNLNQLLSVLKGEHPQVLALVVSYLESQMAFEFLRTLEEDVRYDVVRRIAMTDDLPYEAIRQVDAILELRAHEISAQATGSAEHNRFETIAQMLNVADPGISKTILDRLGDELPDDANEIKALMFVFEDLMLIPDKDLQKALGDIDKDTLALALKVSTPEVEDKLLGNLSKRARESILEEIEMLGPKPLKEVEEAQKEIVEVIRRLEERGEITISRGAGEEMV
jgi:flagellar motor switch protein FliG